MKKPPRDDTIDPQTQCRLLGLPPELRNKIYEYTLYVGEVRIAKIIDQSKPFSVLELLQTCRQIREEAAAIYYDINELGICGYKTSARERSLGTFVREAPQAQLDRITKLTVSCRAATDAIEEDLRQIARLTELRALKCVLGANLFRHTAANHVSGRRRSQWVAEIKRLVSHMPHIERTQLTLRPGRADRSGRRAGKYKEIEKEVQNMIDQRRGVWAIK